MLWSDSFKGNQYCGQADGEHSYHHNIQIKEAARFESDNGQVNYDHI